MTDDTTTVGTGPAAHEMTAAYVQAFNAGDAEAIELFYTEDAVTVWEPGVAASGDARRQGTKEFLARKPHMTAAVRESYVTGDAALFVVDWTIDIPAGPGGPEEHLSGVGLDVLRLGADGVWRYAVDNPFGDA
jgi:uncharacterized protein (TIGR02246 family)